MRKKVTAWLLALVMVLSYGSMTAEAAGPTMEVYYFNTGQSDCMLVLFGTKSILIDSGSDIKGTSPTPASKQQNIKSFLQQRNITTLDALIITHCDPDHYRGITNLVAGISTINRIYFRKYDLDTLKLIKTHSSSTYTNYINVVNFIAEQDGQSKISTTATPEALASFGDTLERRAKWVSPAATINDTAQRISFSASVGNTIYLYFYNREESFIRADDPKLVADFAANVNNDSLTFGIEYDSRRFLFPGDVVWGGRNQMVRVAEKAHGDGVKFDVFKAAHHGSYNNNLLATRPTALGMGEVINASTTTIVTNDPSTGTVIFELNQQRNNWPSKIYATGTISKHITAAEKNRLGIGAYGDMDYLAIKVSTDGTSLTTQGVFRSSNYPLALMSIGTPTVPNP